MTNANVEVKAAEKPAPSEAEELEDEITSLRDFFSWRPLLGRRRPWRALLRETPFPAMDVYTKENNLEIRVELPGISEKDVEITVEAGTLAVSGHKSQSKEIKEKDYYRSEREYGSFYRSVALPTAADVENIRAEFKDGVLEIDVPLKGAPAGKKIEIKRSA